MKKEKVLNLQDLHDTAAACHWYYSSKENIILYKKMREKNNKISKSCKKRLRIDFKENLKYGFCKITFYKFLVYAFVNGYTQKFVKDCSMFRCSSSIEKSDLQYPKDVFDTEINTLGKAIYYFQTFFEISNDELVNDEDDSTEYYGYEYKLTATYNLIYNLLAWIYFSGYDYIKDFSYITKKYKLSQINATQH